MKKLLSDSSKLLVKFLLTKPKIAEKVFVDVKNNKEYKIYDVLDDGTIYLGESSIPFAYSCIIFPIDLKYLVSILTSVLAKSSMVLILSS